MVLFIFQFPATIHVLICFSLYLSNAAIPGRVMAFRSPEKLAAGGDIGHFRVLSGILDCGFRIAPPMIETARSRQLLPPARMFLLKVQVQNAQRPVQITVFCALSASVNKFFVAGPLSRPI
jgi:hypothetical protein